MSGHFPADVKRAEIKNLVNFFCFTILMMLVLPALSCSTAHKDNPAGKRVVQVNLKAGKSNAGAFGRAIFIAAGEKSEIEIYLTGLPMGVQRPVHIYTYLYRGPCSKVGGNPEFELNETVRMSISGHDAWKTTRMIPMDLSSLVSGGYSIVIRSSPADGNRDLFCGDIHP